MHSETIELAAGKLFALVNGYALDGRESSHPLDVRGFTTMNSYLLVEDDRALLWGTGFTVHQEALLAQLAPLVGDRTLSLLIPRTEFAGMCNARPIADRFPVDIAYMRIPSPPTVFLNFRPEFSQSETDGLRDVPYELIERGHMLPVDLAGRRCLEVLSPELRLMPNSWGYDALTRTLFVPDAFSWVWRDTEVGPWLIDDGDADPTTAERVEHCLVHNRFWWLPGADIEPIRESMADLFDSYAIETIAPDHGCILRGEVIQRHYQLLDDYLVKASTLPSVGIAAGSWRAVAAR